MDEALPSSPPLFLVWVHAGEGTVLFCSSVTYQGLSGEQPIFRLLEAPRTQERDLPLFPNGLKFCCFLWGSLKG